MRKRIKRKNRKSVVRSDYDSYRLSKREWAVYLGKAAALCCCLNFFCYRSWWAFPALVPLGIWYVRQAKKDRIRKRKQKINYQFRTVLQSLNTAVRAGYSLENAVGESRKDVQKIYGEKDELVRELIYIENQMAVGIPVEKLFQDLGERSHVEDIQSFGEVLGIAKRTGGNLAGIMEQMNQVLGEKIRVKQEIDVNISGKKMEQMVMSLVPGGMILYMQISSGSFLSILYHNAAGVFVMTVCLAVYLFSFRMGRKIVAIDV